MSVWNWILGRLWTSAEETPAPAPGRLVRALARLSDDQLDRLERGIPRQAILWLIAVALPLRFNTQHAGDLAATVELRFLRPDGGEPDPIAITIADGRCRTGRRPATAPDATCAASLKDLLRLATGDAKVHILWLSGELVTTGDTELFLRFPQLFSGRGRARSD
ncbi:MAG: hypothetical protein GEU94_12595 [Micromonosporaceae bacterium]|nr:hypothetical protein [Micromonosporaceae bacterium]